MVNKQTKQKNTFILLGQKTEKKMIPGQSKIQQQRTVCSPNPNFNLNFELKPQEPFVLYFFYEETKAYTQT